MKETKILPRILQNDKPKKKQNKASLSVDFQCKHVIRVDKSLYVRTYIYLLVFCKKNPLTLSYRWCCTPHFLVFKYKYLSHFPFPNICRITSLWKCQHSFAGTKILLRFSLTFSTTLKTTGESKHKSLNRWP